MSKIPSHKRFEISQRKAAATSVLAGLLVLIAVGCEEALPPYTPVQNFTEGVLTRFTEIGGPADTLTTLYIPQNCPNYCTTQFKVALKNTYEETLQGKRYVRAWLELDTIEAPFTFHRSFYKEIIEPPNVDLTLDPGQSYDVVFAWNRRDDDGVLLDDLVQAAYFDVREPPKEAPPIKFRFRANIQVWKNVPPRVTNEYVIRFIHYILINCIEGCN